MVRFIMRKLKMSRGYKKQFTFQYGQIYYSKSGKTTILRLIVYIPIWLDLLYLAQRDEKIKKEGLHSNMVRFIIKIKITKNIQSL